MHSTASASCHIHRPLPAGSTKQSCGSSRQAYPQQQFACLLAPLLTAHGSGRSAATPGSVCTALLTHPRTSPAHPRPEPRASSCSRSNLLHANQFHNMPGSSSRIFAAATAAQVRAERGAGAPLPATNMVACPACLCCHPCQPVSGPSSNHPAASGTPSTEAIQQPAMCICWCSPLNSNRSDC